MDNLNDSYPNKESKNEPPQFNVLLYYIDDKIHELEKEFDAKNSEICDRLSILESQISEIHSTLSEKTLLPGIQSRQQFIPSDLENKLNFFDVFVNETLCMFNESEDSVYIVNCEGVEGLELFREFSNVNEVISFSNRIRIRYVENKIILSKSTKR